MRNLVVLALASALSACLSPAEPDCFEVPATVAPLRGGGWDLNGRSLGGGGGWDYNGRTLGEGLEALAVMDARSGAALAVVRGSLESSDGVPVASGVVVLRGALSSRTTTAQIDRVRVDDGVPLYDVRVEGSPLCDGLAMLAPGAWSARGDHVAGPGVTLACEHGAIAKCALWGYAPWVVGDAEHAACTRMVRADYCGDGSSWTRDGTLVDVTDVDGVQQLAGGMAFEAGWDEAGAVCVRASRYQIVGASGETLLPPCWAALPRCDDAEAAFAGGALVANHALGETVAACR